MPEEPLPFWLYYFDIDDIDAAAERVKTGGGQIFEGPLELPGGSWIVRCRDPQGAAFALQGKRSQDASASPCLGSRLVHRVGRVFIERQVGHQAPRLGASFGFGRPGISQP